ncbi:MAG: sensor histidine kinase [Anaerolineae bacterium]|nr:sensor histidine kinase [Anaerolineae bacterium]
MKWQRWGLALIPIVAGLVIASLMVDIPTLTNPIIYMRVDLGTLAVIIGLALSVLVTVGLVLWGWAGRRGEQRVTGVRAQVAEERRRFLQRLDHELKNPLTAIRAGLANLANGRATATLRQAQDTAQQEALASVEAQVLRLSRLTSDLRKLAELETRPLERVPVDVAELLQEAVTLAQEQPEAEARQFTLTLPQAPWPVPDVLGDWDLLFLATYNLLDNALKFTRPGDTVEVRAFEGGTFVAIEVADTGPGIPQEELPRVWEELYRGQSARGVPGSGLGLTLVRAIVEGHGGQVTLRSRVGQGTVVTMRLPA